MGGVEQATTVDDPRRVAEAHLGAFGRAQGLDQEVPTNGAE